MKTIPTNFSQESAFSFCEGNINKVEGLAELLGRFSKRIQVSHSGFYRRAMHDISLFHACFPDALEVDEIPGYLLPVGELPHKGI